MIRALCVLALVGLAGCGVDGEPLPPESKPETGLTISGRAEIGIVKR